MIGDFVEAKVFGGTDSDIVKGVHTGFAGQNKEIAIVRGMDKFYPCETSLTVLPDPEPEEKRLSSHLAHWRKLLKI